MGEARWVAQGAGGARDVRRERRGGRPRGRGEGEYEGVDTAERAVCELKQDHTVRGAVPRFPRSFYRKTNLETPRT